MSYCISSKFRKGPEMSPVTSKGIRPEADVYRRAVKDDWQRQLCHVERHPSQDQYPRRTTKVGGSKSITIG